MGIPNIVNLTGDVSVAVAARSPKYLFPLHRSSISRMCSAGVFKTAHKKGNGGKTSPWFISGAEIIQHKLSGHATIRY